MQIIKAVVTPIELDLRQPVSMACIGEIKNVTAVFVRLDTRQGVTAWGCTVAQRDLTGEDPQEVIHSCHKCADMAPDLHPTDIEYSLNQLTPHFGGSPAVRCAFDLAFHDLLGLAASLPLYRLLGGYRHRIQTSVTVPVSSVQESVARARAHANSGFRILKVKGGQDPELDVKRVQAIRRALPDHTLHLDADGGYSVQQSLDVMRALRSDIEMLEQPTPAGDLESLKDVSTRGRMPILADQSVGDPASALKIAAEHASTGMSVKLASCGGLNCAKQIDSIARAAHIATMVSCLIEPALLIAAGLSFALSSPNVRYGDLDGHLDVINDPTTPGFHLEEGWLITSDIPGLGCSVDL